MWGEGEKGGKHPNNFQKGREKEKERGGLPTMM